MIENSVLFEDLNRLSGSSVLCVGDVMLDRFVYGGVERISPEAPIPVLLVEREKHMLGGAGNVVANIAALGGKAVLLAVVGNDAAGADVARLLSEMGVEAGLEILIVHDDTPVLEVFEQFKAHPIRMAAVVDANNELKGIVTQTDLLEAIIGYIPAAEGEEPEAVQQNGNSWMMDGGMLVAAAFDQLQIRERPPHGNFHTLAGFALFQLQRIPVAGESFIWQGWKFAIAAMKGRRIEKLLVSRE